MEVLLYGPTEETLDTDSKRGMDGRTHIQGIKGQSIAVCYKDTSQQPRLLLLCDKTNSETTFLI